MSKYFALEHFCEPLMGDASYFSKPMFVGLTIYYLNLMRFVLVESEGDREYRGQNFDFDLWNGVLLCTSREHHPSLISQWTTLIPHPVLGKWLYLKMTDLQFESVFQELVECVINNDLRIGIVPGQRKHRKTKIKKNSDKVRKTKRKRKNKK
ncbi:MAG: hypothetical protein KDD40_09505 [Bdellovibrionales bacterium]|nr:hypothetical protein [Bdellovibrionales bacterium]